MTRVRRTIVGGLELRSVTDAEKANGYLGALEGKIPYNADSKTLRDRRLNNGQPFVERIAPKAFTRSIAENKDITAMAGHTDDPLAAFARAGENLTFTETDTALLYRALIPNTSAGRDLLELAEKKIIRGTSFEFDLGAKDRWEKRDDGLAVRTVTEGEFATVNPVVWPAYDDSELSVSMRGGRRGGIDRGIYAYADTYDPSLTCDVAYAMEALSDELEELGDALDYLRCIAQPDTTATGALKDYAQGEVKESISSIKLLLDFIATSGGDVNPALVKRAGEKLTEARAAVKPSPQSLADADWDQRRSEALVIAPN